MGKNGYHNNVGLYSITGEFIINVDIPLSTPSSKFIEIKDHNIIIFGKTSQAIIIDKKINIIKEDIKAPLYDHIKFINDTQYITYNSSSITFFNLDTLEYASINVNAFINSKYPNESHEPKFTIEEIEIKSDYSIVYIEVTLYNGTIDNIEMKLNNETGEFIK